MLMISEKAKISPLADIEDSVRGSKIIIDDGAFLDSFVKIKAAGGNGDVRIGRNCSINSGVVMYIGNGITIGNDVAIGANTVLAPTNHEFRDPDRPIREQRFLPSRGGIVVEDDVWIGASVVLLDGAILRKGCVVGAGSLVRGELPPYSVNYGNPIQTIGYRGKDKFKIPVARKTA
jgi:virginiamycin A acetyltransferase